MEVSLEKLVNGVWDKRGQLLFGAGDEPNDTLDDRIYALYASKDILEHIVDLPAAKQQYCQRHKAVDACALKCRLPPRGSTEVWRFYGSDGNYDWRIYLNAKPSYVHLACVKVLRMNIEPGYDGAAIKRVKIPQDTEAFTERCDSVVVWINGSAQQAMKLGQKLSRQLPGKLYEDVPPMTLKVASGISCGKGLAATPLAGVGKSFGAARCTLIARALLLTLSGSDSANLRDNIMRAEYKSTTEALENIPLGEADGADIFSDYVDQLRAVFNNTKAEIDNLFVVSSTLLPTRSNKKLRAPIPKAVEALMAKHVSQQASSNLKPVFIDNVKAQFLANSLSVDTPWE